MMQDAGCRMQGAKKSVMQLFHWGDNRACRALRELRMAGLLAGGARDTEENARMDAEQTTNPNLHPLMLLDFAGVSLVTGVTGATDTSDTTDTGCKNREQNGQEIRFASLDAIADAGSDAGSDAFP